jgi:hypothetical protein
MSTVLLPQTDPRGAKAVAIATDAGQWLKCHIRDGRKAYGIPSSRGDGRYYLTTRTSCDCFDGQRHTCKHVLAVRLFCELVAEQHAAKKYDEIFQRFDDEPLVSAAWTQRQHGVIPASQIERED